MSTNLFEIIMQMANFLILLWLLVKFLFKPLGQVLQQREDTIKQDLESATSAREEAASLLANQQQSLNEARLEAKRIREEADEASKRERAAALTEAKQSAEKLLQNARKEMDQNVEKAKKDLLQEVGRLSVNLTGKILKREMQQADHETVMNEYLEKIQPSS